MTQTSFETFGTQEKGPSSTFICNVDMLWWENAKMQQKFMERVSSPPQHLHGMANVKDNVSVE